MEYFYNIANPYVMKRTYILLFVLLASTTDFVFAQENTFCENAIAVDVGSHTAPKAPSWYYYVIQEAEKKVTISTVGLTHEDTHLIIYDSCGGNLIAANDDYSDLQSEVSLFNPAVGDTIFIFWSPTYSSAGFDWTLTVEPIDASDIGINCNYPDTANIGTNTLNPGDFFTVDSYWLYWYSFVMPEENSKIIINSSTNHDVYGVHGSCSNIGEVEYGEGNLQIFNAGYNEEIRIVWAAEADTTSFDWELSIEPLAEGEGCSTAEVAVEGTNSFTSNEYGHWYQFTMPVSDSKIHIDAPQDTYFSAYRNDCSDLTSIPSDNEFGLIYDVEQGETIFLKWEDYLGNREINWTLSIENVIAGETCSLAEIAIVGTNHLPATTLPYYWYSFTMPSDQTNSKVVIGSDPNNYFQLYSNTCDDLTYISDNKTYADPEETIYIKWFSYESGNFDWWLEIEPIESGEFCSSAVTAIEGTNNIPSVNQESYWYEFVAPEDPSKGIGIYADAEVSFAIHRGDCEMLEIIDYGFEKLELTGLVPGEKLYIEWATWNGGQFDFELHTLDFPPGWSCGNAEEVAEGTFEVPYQYHEEYWASYTATEFKRIHIESDGITNYANVQVSTSCWGQVLAQQDGWENNEISLDISGIEIGETILIHWSENENINGVSWSISLEDYPSLSIDQDELTFDLKQKATQSKKLSLANEGGGSMNFSIGTSEGIKLGSPDAYVNIPAENLITPSELSISLWINIDQSLNCDGNNNWRYLLRNRYWDDSGYDIILEEDGSLTWSLGTVGGNLRHHSTARLYQNTWYYLTFTYAASTSEAKIYINGVHSSGTNWENGASYILFTDPYSRTLSFSGDFPDDCPDGSGYFPGSIDELVIRNSVLTDQEILANYSGVLNLNDENIVGYWNFDELIDNYLVEDFGPNQIFGYTYGIEQVISSPNSWIDIRYGSNEIAPASSSDITIEVDATLLKSGMLESELLLLTNDPNNHKSRIPIHIEVEPLGLDGSGTTISVATFPNPMFDTNTIQYILTRREHITISIFNIQGRLVKTLYNGVQDQGKYSLTWNGTDNSHYPLKNGVYFLKFSAGKDTEEIRRIVITR
jgi:hypothetical protein